MVHRDVKTQNVLLMATQATDMATVTKVADFGTVREDVRARENSALPSGTHNRKTHGSTKNIIGTMPYMPTEYFMMGHVSEKTDAFSLGILLIELFTNTSPKDARGVIEHAETDLISTAMKQHPGTFELGIPSQVLDEIAAVVDRLTETKHKKRSSLAAELPELERICKALREAS